MVYLITQISIYLALASLLGVCVGWLIWGEMARRFRTEAAALQSKLTDLEARHWATVSERDNFEKKILDREGEIAGLHKRVLEPAMSAYELDDKMKAAVAEKEEVISQLRDQQRATLALVQARDEEIINLQVRVSASEAHEQALSARAREWEAALAGKDSKLAELEARQQAIVSEMDSKVQNLFTQHQALASGQEKLRNTVTEKDGEIARLQTRLAAAAASLAAASKQQEADREEIARLRQLQAVFAQPLPHDDVTAMAHSYAAARNFQGGNPQEDWSRAENAVRLKMLQECLARSHPVTANV